MAGMGLLPMVAEIVGSRSPIVGFLVHMLISVLIGVGFVRTLGARTCGVASGVGRGLAYGVAWWVLGPETLMPLYMTTRLGLRWSEPASGLAMPSLVGLLLYGAVLGLIVASEAAPGRQVELGSAACGVSESRARTPAC